MKKIILLSIFAAVASCGPKATIETKKPLFEILTQQGNGGANIQFYEILNEQKEIRMLLADENLKNKISSEDTETANFVILNMGQKPSSGYSLTVESVEETADQVILTVKEKGPGEGEMAATVITYPYTIVKVNSKKKIVIK